MTELTSAEVSDMFCLVQKVQLIMEGVHQATSSTIAVQDGKDAGQTIEVSSQRTGLSITLLMRLVD